jgi:fatty acid desaturase
MSDHPLSENPFASPMSSNAPLRDPREMFVIGRDYSGVVLPNRCIRTNVETSPECERRKTLYWASPWIALLILFNLLVLLIVYVLVRKKCEITFSEAKHLTRRRRNRVLFMVLMVAASVGAVIAGLATEVGALVVVGVLAFVISLIALVFVAQPPIRIVRHQDGQFWIRGCSTAFLRDIPQQAN